MQPTLWHDKGSPSQMLCCVALTTAVVAEEDEDVRLEYFLRAPASIGVDAPNLTPSSKVRQAHMAVLSFFYASRARHWRDKAVDASASHQAARWEAPTHRPHPHLHFRVEML
jgi:hypothetical protein